MQTHTVQRNPTLACISQLISCHLSPCTWCTDLSLPYRRPASSQPQGLWICCPGCDLLSTVARWLTPYPSSLNWNVISSEKAILLLKLWSLLWHGSWFLSQHISPTAIILFLGLSFTSYPSARLDDKLHGFFTTVFPVLGLVRQNSVWHKTGGSRNIG